MEFLFKQFFFIFLTIKKGPSVRVENCSQIRYSLTFNYFKNLLNLV